MANHLKYAATLVTELGKISKLAKSRKEELQKLQTSLDDLEQYTQKILWNFVVYPKE